MSTDQAWGVVAQVAASQHGAFDRVQAAERGFRPSALRSALVSGRLVRPRPGVYVVSGSPPTWRQQLAVATLGSPGGIASHRSAAALHGLDGAATGPIEVIVRPGGRTVLPGCVVHQMAVKDADVEVIDGIRRTRPLRTLCDLASVTPLPQVERALDDLLRRGVNVRTAVQVAERLHRPGQRGTGVVLGLLAACRRDSTICGSWFERLVEDCLRATDLPSLARQHEVRTASGDFVARVDLAFPSVRLALEAHSRQFHFGPMRERFDEQRELRLAAAGWLVIYVGWSHLAEPQAVLSAIRSAVAVRSLAA